MPLIAILHDEVGPDARPDDLDTLATAAAVARALHELGHDARPIPLGRDLGAAQTALSALSPTAVFNLVESVDGDAGLLHLGGLLPELLGLPCTGSGSEALLTSANKLLAKKLLRQAEIATPDWVEEKQEPQDGVDSLSEVPLPGAWIVKSVREHASLGLEADSVLQAPTPGLLQAEFVRRAPLLGRAFAERYVDGREFNLSILERDGQPVVLPPAEMRFLGEWPERGRVVGYRAKWHQEAEEYRRTVRSFDFPPEDVLLLTALGQTALRAWRALGLAGYARIDFRVDPDSPLPVPYVIDVNPNPGLAPDAGFPAAAAMAGLCFTDLVAAVLDAARTDGARPHTSP